MSLINNSLDTSEGKNHLVELVMKSLGDFKQITDKLGFNLNTFTPDSVEILKSFPSQRIEGIYKHLSSYNEIIRLTLNNGSDNNIERIWDIKDEEYCLNKALWTYNFFAKEDINKYIQMGDVIEIYSVDSVQIYRNFEFIKLCSYSLLEIMTHEWFVLYDRPEFVTELLMKHMGEVFRTKSIVKVNIPEHEMKEKYLNARKVFRNKFKYFIPLFEKSKSEPVAFIATLRVVPKYIGA